MFNRKISSLSCLAAATAVALVACGKQDPQPRVAQHEPSSLTAAPAAPPAAAPAVKPEPVALEQGASSSTGAGSSTSDTTSRSSLSTTTDAPGAPAEAGAQTEPARTPDVVYVPTPQPVVDKMLALAQVKKGDVVYDLGCGDGRIVVTAAKRYGVKAYGFDIDPARVAEARANVRAAKLEDLVSIEQKDIFTLDLSPANVVTLYLLPKLNVRLIPQLEKLKPGSRIVSHDFDMAGVKPEKHLTLRPTGESSEHQVYLWKTPLVKE